MNDDVSVRLTFHRLPVAHPAIDALLYAIRCVYANGSAALACFHVPKMEVAARAWRDWTYEWICKGLMFSPELAMVLADPALQYYKYSHVPAAMEQWRANLLGGLQQDYDRQQQIWEHAGFRLDSPFTLDDQLTEVLLRGGAYERFKGTVPEARTLARGFALAICEDRELQCHLYSSHAPWCPFFFDIAWDQTWILIDRGKQNIWVLCISDTD